MQVKYGVKKGVISLVAVGLLMVCTSTLMFVHNPLHSIIRLILTLRDGSIFFNLWSNPPYEIRLNLYLFNITNPEEFMSGTEKMNVTQLGPFSYKEILTNQNATFNDTDGTVTFQPHREIVFDPDGSVGDPETTFMMTTNLPLVGLQAYLNDANYFTNLGFAAVARSFGSEPIRNLSVHQYLFGYDDPLIHYANKFLPNWIDFDNFGIFARLISRDNGNTVTIVKDPTKYHSETESFLTEEERMGQYHVAKWNGIAGIKEWGYDQLTSEEITKCHLVEGAFDGTIFPRNMPHNRSLTMFRKAFCRPVPMEFVRDVVGKAGFRQYEYKLADNMFDVNEQNKCFCYKNRCVKGFQSIAPCYYGIPITLSQPHYLNADPEMLDTVVGLSPDPIAHGSMAAIQPDIGAPLEGSMKIQINLDVGRTKGNSKTVRFNNLQVPLFWIEITTQQLPTMVVILLQLICHVLPVALDITKYSLGVGGLVLISGSACYTLLKSRVGIPGGISLKGDYVPLPIVTIQTEFLEKCEKRLTGRK